MKKNLPLSLLHTIALVVLLAGAVASLGLMLHAGRNNNSILLILLFFTWVLSPFIVLLAANKVSKTWAVPSRITLYSLMLFVTICSLVCYSGVWSPPGTKPAFVFLVVPLVSWLLMAIVIPLTSSWSKRLLLKNNSI